VCVCVCVWTIKNMATVRNFDIVPDECIVVGSCKVATENNAQKYSAVL
jgi:hypothetical protein